MRSEQRKETFEDDFARSYYCNTERFIHKMKRRNNKMFRKHTKDQIKQLEEIEDYEDENI